MFATPKLLGALASIVVGLVLLLVESLWVILGDNPLGTADKVLLWLGFGLIAAGAAALVWAIATETPADEPALPASPQADEPDRSDEAAPANRVVAEEEPADQTAEVNPPLSDG